LSTNFDHIVAFSIDAVRELTRSSIPYEVQWAQTNEVMEQNYQKAMKEVVDAYELVMRTRSTLKTLEEELNRASGKRLAYTRKWNRKMQLPFMEVLAAEAAQLQLKSHIVETRLFVNESQRGLHLATWGGN
jgi:hypothetical protein